MRHGLTLASLLLLACGGTIEDRATGDATTTGTGTTSSTSTTAAGTSTSAVTSSGAGGSIDAGGAGGAGGEGGAGGAGGVPMLVGGGGAGDAEIVRLCVGHVYACGNGVDDDGDALVDAADPDCHGACDDREDTLWNPMGDDFSPCGEDCHFDGENGAGNDGCHWDFRCDPSSVAPTFDPTGEEVCAHDPEVAVPPGPMTCDELRTAQARLCLAVCLPVVPNGCDCFGCCARPHGSGTFWMGSHDEDWVEGCSTATLDDPSICRPCEQVPSCINPCDPCEVCLGGVVPAAGCDPAAQCPAGVQACGLPGQPLCPDATYCVSGCCRDVVR